MKFVKYFLITLTTVLLLFVAVTFFLPKDYYVERELGMNAPAELIFSQAADLEAWQTWSPWNDLDPDMVITYGDKKVGEGASYSWESEVAGTGTLVITKVKFPTEVYYDLLFEGYEDSPSKAVITISAGANEQVVKWSFAGDVGDNFFGRWMTLLMDKFVGSSYEQGLATLKEKVESMDTLMEETKGALPIGG